MRHQITLPVTVSIPEAARPFDDSLILQRMREAVSIPPAARLLRVRILGKEKASDRADFVITGELTFGRWFPFRKDPMSIRTKVFDFGQTAQSVITDYFTYPTGKVSFGGEDFPTFQASGNAVPRYTRADFIAAGKRCAASYQRHLEEGGEDDLGSRLTILMAELETMGAEAGQ
jgi:hypothetical protein